MDEGRFTRLAEGELDDFECVLNELSQLKKDYGNERTIS
jgi:hypothetical protein